MLSNSWSTSGEQFDRIFQTFFTGSLNRSEARLALIAEYLECCASNLLPYNAVKTVYKLTRQMAPREPVHPTHQLRLANSIQPMSFAVENSTELSQAIMHSDCWKIYATGRKTEKKVTLHRNKLNEAGWGRWPWPWLDDPIARQKVKQVFTDYETKLTASGDSPDILARLQFILEGIDSWHPEGESSHTQRRVPESDIKVDRLAAE
ncbi:hypothetical protein DFH06DRAFT_1197022 [Mycena polygramma]|nr:hypothetical protein DFH06DRAFT_1197022 [Mycena polygramma]